MIEVNLYFSADGGFYACRASGHAGYAIKGFDIVCAAATVLLRTTVAALDGIQGLIIEAEAPERGFLAFRAAGSGEAEKSLLAYAGMFLREGFASLAAEYPASLSVRILNESEY